MAKVRCQFCHELIDEAVLAEHVEAHMRLREDGQQEEYVTLPPEERQQGDLAGVPRVYLHRRCGAGTGMSEEIIRSYLAAPFLYGGGTFCTGCGKLVPEQECTWVETGEKLDVYFRKLQAAASSGPTPIPTPPPFPKPAGGGGFGVLLLVRLFLAAWALQAWL